MERIQPMNELQIQEKVEDLAGKSARILDCEQNTLNQMEEVLLVNGVSISLAGEEGAKIKQALIHGEVPPCDLVNNMLIRAGIEKNPVELETTVNVKSSTKTVEHSQLVDSNGVLVDEKMREKEDEDEFKTVNVEIWNTEHANNFTEHRPAGGKKANAIAQGKTKGPENGKSNKKSLFSPSKLMKLSKHSQLGATSAGRGKGASTYRTASQLVPLADASKKGPESSHSQKIGTVSEPNSSAKMENSPEGSQKSQKNNKILSFFLKGNSKEGRKKSSSLPSSKPTHRSFETEVRMTEEGTKSNQFSMISPLVGGDKDTCKKKKPKNPSSFIEPKYDNIVHSSSAIMSAHPKFKNKSSSQHQDTRILDPALSLINVDIDGVPARVTYETFV